MSARVRLIIVCCVLIAGIGSMSPALAYNVNGSLNGISILSGTMQWMGLGVSMPIGAGGCGPVKLTIQVTNGAAKVIAADMPAGAGCIRLIPNGLPWNMEAATGPGYTPFSIPINPMAPDNNVRITGVSITNPIFGVTCTGAISKGDLNSSGKFWVNQTLGPAGCTLIANELTSNPPLLPLP
jgi:hypothetical protein